MMAPRRYTCLTCKGAGTVEAFGAVGGRFYNYGDRAPCPECSGIGSVEKWRQPNA